MTRTLRHMYRHIQTHTHAPCAVSFSLWCHRRNGAAAGGTASVSWQQEQALRHSVSRQMQRARASCMAMGHIRESQSPEHSTYENKRYAMHSNDGDGTSTAATREHSRQNQDVQCYRRGNSYMPAASPPLRRALREERDVICCE